MEPQRLALLEELMLELAAEQRGSYVPLSIFHAAHKLWPLPTTELVIVRPEKPRHVLLDYRHDEWWEGYHLIGGYELQKERSLFETCNRVAGKELGIGLAEVKLFAQFRWPNHPYGAPSSACIVANPVGDISETAHRRYVNIDEPYPLLVPNHAEILDAYKRYLVHAGHAEILFT